MAEATPRWTPQQRRWFVGGWVTVIVILGLIIGAAALGFIPTPSFLSTADEKPFTGVVVPVSVLPGSVVNLKYTGSFTGVSLWRFSLTAGSSYIDLDTSETDTFTWTVPDNRFTLKGRVEVSNALNASQSRPSALFRVAPSFKVTGPGDADDNAVVEIGAQVAYLVEVAGQHAMDALGIELDLQTQQDGDATWRSEATTWTSGTLMWTVPLSYQSQLRYARITTLGLAPFMDEEMVVKLPAPLVVRTPGAVQNSRCFGRFLKVRLDSEFPAHTPILSCYPQQTVVALWTTTGSGVGAVKLLYSTDGTTFVDFVDVGANTNEWKFNLPLVNGDVLYLRVQGVSTADHAELGPIPIERRWSYRPINSALSLWNVTFNWIIEIPLRIAGGAEVSTWKWWAILKFPELDDKTWELSGPNAATEAGTYTFIQLLSTDEEQNLYSLLINVRTNLPEDVPDETTVQLGLCVAKVNTIPTWTWCPTIFRAQRPLRIVSGPAFTSIVYWPVDADYNDDRAAVEVGATTVLQPGRQYQIGYLGSHVGSPSFPAPVDYFLTDALGVRYSTLGYTEGTARTLLVTLPKQAAAGTGRLEVSLRALAPGNAMIALSVPLVLTPSGVTFPTSISARSGTINLTYAGLSRPLTSNATWEMQLLQAATGDTASTEGAWTSPASTTKTITNNALSFSYSCSNTATSVRFRLSERILTYTSPVYTLPAVPAASRGSRREATGLTVLGATETTLCTGELVALRPPEFVEPGVSVVAGTLCQGQQQDGAAQTWDGVRLYVVAPPRPAPFQWTWTLPDGTRYTSGELWTTQMGLRAHLDPFVSRDWRVGLYVEHTATKSTAGLWVITVLDETGAARTDVAAVPLLNTLRWLPVRGQNGWRPVLLQCQLSGVVHAFLGKLKVQWNGAEATTQADYLGPLT